MQSAQFSISLNPNTLPSQLQSYYSNGGIAGPQLREMKPKHLKKLFVLLCNDPEWRTSGETIEERIHQFILLQIFQMLEYHYEKRRLRLHNLTICLLELPNGMDQRGEQFKRLYSEAEKALDKGELTSVQAGKIAQATRRRWDDVAKYITAEFQVKSTNDPAECHDLGKGVDCNSLLFSTLSPWSEALSTGNWKHPFAVRCRRLDVPSAYLRMILALSQRGTIHNLHAEPYEALLDLLQFAHQSGIQPLLRCVEHAFIVKLKKSSEEPPICELLHLSLQLEQSRLVTACFDAINYDRPIVLSYNAAHECDIEVLKRNTDLSKLVTYLLPRIGIFTIKDPDAALWITELASDAPFPLRRLDLTNCTDLSWEILNRLANAFPDLATLVLEPHHVSGKLFHQACPFGKLETVVLNSCQGPLQNTSDRIFKHSKASVVINRHKRTIILRSSPRAELGMSAFLDYREGEPTLTNRARVFQACVSVSFTDGLLFELSKHIAATGYWLSSCPNLSERGLMEVFHDSSKVRRFEANHCPGVTNRMLNILSTQASQLHSLALQDCGNITPQGIAPFVKIGRQLLKKTGQRMLKKTRVTRGNLEVLETGIFK